MTYTLIKGTFHVVGYSPDGDSLKFKANNPKHWDKIVTDNRDKLEENIASDNGAVQLRLQGVDALETHYSPPPLPTPADVRHKVKSSDKPDGGDHKQPEELGKAATTALLEMLGVTQAQWRHFGRNTWIDRAYIRQKRGKGLWVDDKQSDNIPGYIVTDDAEKNGRPIAWVFPGTTRSRDGGSLTPGKLAQRVERSANYQLLKLGLVYPYFFMTLPGKLRDKLAEAAQYALAEAKKYRARRSGDKHPNLWVYDRTIKGLHLTDLNQITHQSELYSYLFRKILKHWYGQNLNTYWEALRNDEPFQHDENDMSVSLEDFFEGGNPYLFVISDQDFVRLDQVLEIKRGTLKMKKYPFDIVFLS